MSIVPNAGKKQRNKSKGLDHSLNLLTSRSTFFIPLSALSPLPSVLGMRNFQVISSCDLKIKERLDTGKYIHILHKSIDYENMLLLTGLLTGQFHQKLS